MNFRVLLFSRDKLLESVRKLFQSESLKNYWACLFQNLLGNSLSADSCIGITVYVVCMQTAPETKQRCVLGRREILAMLWLQIEGKNLGHSDLELFK